MDGLDTCHLNGGGNIWCVPGRLDSMVNSGFKKALALLFVKHDPIIEQQAAPRPLGGLLDNVSFATTSRRSDTDSLMTFIDSLLDLEDCPSLPGPFLKAVRAIRKAVQSNCP